MLALAETVPWSSPQLQQMVCGKLLFGTFFFSNLSFDGTCIPSVLGNSMATPMISCPRRAATCHFPKAPTRTLTGIQFLKQESVLFWAFAFVNHFPTWSHETVQDAEPFFSSRLHCQGQPKENWWQPSAQPLGISAKAAIRAQDTRSCRSAVGPAAPSKYKTNGVCSPLTYLFLAMSHGVTPLR